jgi:hypothetical protein
MHPIFFAWNGDHDSLQATRFYAHGPRTRTIAVVHGKAYFGLIEAETPAVRKEVAKLHDNLVVLPGPRGKVSSAQANALNTMFPQLNVKEGDSLESTLLHVHALYGDEEFHPDNY